MNCGINIITVTVFFFLFLKCVNFVCNSSKHLGFFTDIIKVKITSGKNSKHFR